LRYAPGRAHVAALEHGQHGAAQRSLDDAVGGAGQGLDQAQRQVQPPRRRIAEPGAQVAEKLAEADLLGPDRLEQQVLRLVVAEQAGDHVGQVLDGDRLQLLAAVAGHRQHQRQRRHRPDQRGAAIGPAGGPDQRRTQHDPVEAGRHQGVVAGVLAAQEGAVGGIAEGGDLHHLAHAGLGAGGKQGGGRGPVHGVERSAPILAQDTGAVDHGVDALQARQPVGRGMVAGEVADDGAGAAGRLRARAHGGDHLVPVGGQHRRHVGADEALRAGDQHLHLRPPPSVAAGTSRSPSRPDSLARNGP